MKKVKYRNNNNNNYNSQVYSINYKFDSVSPAGKICGTALDLIKKYNELAKEAQANNNYVEAEVFRQYAEHYRKIITEINERKNIRFNNKETHQNNNESEENQETSQITNETASDSDSNVQPTENNVAVCENTENTESAKENTFVETKVKSTKRSFKIVEVSDKATKTKKTIKNKNKKEETSVVNE